MQKQIHVQETNPSTSVRQWQRGKSGGVITELQRPQREVVREGGCVSNTLDLNPSLFQLFFSQLNHEVNVEHDDLSPQNLNKVLF